MLRLEIDLNDINSDGLTNADTGTEFFPGERVLVFESEDRVEGDAWVAREGKVRVDWPSIRTMSQHTIQMLGDRLGAYVP